MTFRLRLLALAPALLGVPALPGLAHAQRCVVAEIEVPSMEVRVGAREPMVVIFRDRNGLPCAEDPRFVATSNNTAILRIERENYVGVSAGSAVVTIRVGTGRTARTGVGAISVVAEAPVAPPPSVAPPPVTVSPPPATVVPSGARGPGASTLQYQPEGSGPAAGIVTEPDRMLLLPGESRFLNYRTADVRGGRAERLPMQFAIEPASVTFVTVDTIGIVTAIDTGRATIRVTAVGRPNVTAPPVPVEVRADSVAFQRRRHSMAPGATDTVLLRVPGQDRNIDIRSRFFRFESSDTGVAAVHLLEPVIESRRPGQATVTANYPRLRSVELLVNVFRPVTAIQLGDSAITIAITQRRRVVMRPVADTQYVREAPATVSGLDTTRVAARYDTTTGTFELTGRASGQTSITMRVQSGRDSTTAVERTLRIRVVAGGLLLSRTRVGLGAGERTPVAASLLDDQRRPIAGLTPEVVWTSSDTTVASFENGQIVGRGVGPARLVALTPWGAADTVTVFVVNDMLVVKQQAGAWNLYGRTAGPENAHAGYPAVSPDGERLLYVSQRTGQTNSYDIFVANFADGSGERRLTSWTRADDSPSWAPDGQSFFFLRDEGEPQRGRPTKRVYRWDMRTDSATAVSALGSFVTAFGVSGDGRSLALNVLEQGVTRMYTLDVAAGTTTPIQLDISELVGPGSPVALRPVTTQPAAASGTAPAPAARP